MGRLDFENVAFPDVCVHHSHVLNLAILGGRLSMKAHFPFLVSIGAISPAQI